MLLSPYLLLLYFLNSVACFYSNVLLKASSFFDSDGYLPMEQSCNSAINCLSFIWDGLLVFGGHSADSLLYLMSCHALVTNLPF